MSSKTIEWGGSSLTLETGMIARQADGAVMVSYGDTRVLCAVVAKKTATEGVDFFPLTINYIEKAYAAGKIPGGFFKREAKPSERETLISRLIDRPIRPLFPEGFNHEVQVTCTVMSYDENTDSDIAAMVGVSAALAISGAPFQGPIGVAKVGYIDDEYVLNPSIADLEQSRLELTVAATKDSVMMVESEADCLSEEVMLGAVNFGHEQMQPIINMINEFKEEVGNDVWEFTSPDLSDLYSEISGKVSSSFKDAYAITNKQERVAALDAARTTVLEGYAESEEVSLSDVSAVLKKIEKSIVRGQLIESGTRIDGRKGDQVRSIDCQVGILPKVHGSALFTRGETQALVTTTLGTAQDEQIVDNMIGDSRENFMLH
ncbi:MAG: polyribonucleotide nucleotidyltransferase, partial [Rickettsiales bacterium]|nr:polyribonucleotide nucleotidyltransferase [Rickettsiales bacterium]